MARINIEECWWSDPRRSKLIRLFQGNTREADGLVIEAWRLAQEYWKHDRQLIPIHHFESLEANSKLIEANLAEIRENGVYVRGSSQYLDWVNERRKSASRGGKKSAESRKKKGSAQPKKAKNVEANSKQTEANVNQTQASSSSSSSFSSSSSSSDSLKNISQSASASDSGDNQGASDRDMNRETWEAYREAYKKRYFEDPVRNAAVNSKIAQLVNRLGDEAPAVAKFYLTHNKQFYVQNLHPIGMLLSEAESLRTQWATGRKVTGIQAKQAELQDANVDAVKLYLAGKGNT